MKWHIVRHADKEMGDYFNPVLRHQDEPISAQGRADAQSLMHYFAGLSIAEIYISEYVRTRQTVEPLSQSKGLTPLVDTRLNEFDNGRIEGLTEREIETQFPQIWNCLKQRDRDFQFPDGESGAGVLKRVDSFMREKQSVGRDILVVSHDGLIRTWMCRILGLPVYKRWDFKVEPCGITEIEYQPDFRTWRILRFNQVGGNPRN